MKQEPNAIRYSERRKLPLESVLALYRANKLVVGTEAGAVTQGAPGVGLAGHGLGWHEAYRTRQCHLRRLLGRLLPALARAAGLPGSGHRYGTHEETRGALREIPPTHAGCRWTGGGFLPQVWIRARGYDRADVGLCRPRPLMRTKGWSPALLRLSISLDFASLGHVNILQLRVTFHRCHTEVAADAALLEPAEWRFGVDAGMRVDAQHAALDGFGHAKGAPQVIRPERAAEAVGRGIHVTDHFRLIAERRDA